MLGINESKLSCIANVKMMHFLECVNNIRKSKEHTSLNLKELCEVAANTPAPQYYVTPKHTLARYRIWKKTGVISCKYDVNKRMYEEIFRKYEEAMASEKNTDNKHITMGAILTSPASSFFIKESFVLPFYYRAVKYKRSLLRK